MIVLGSLLVLQLNGDIGGAFQGIEQFNMGQGLMRGIEFSIGSGKGSLKTPRQGRTLTSLRILLNGNGGKLVAPVAGHLTNYIFQINTLDI